MIDTDKYEGHTEGSWTLYHRAGNKPTIAGKLSEVDWELIADAPLLLEELKRLHKGIKEAIHHLTYPAKYDKEVQEQTDKLKELIG